MLTHTTATPEPEWGDTDRAAVDALMDWENDLHTCGRPLSESLQGASDDPPAYVVGTRICRACKQVHDEAVRHRSKDKALTDAGHNPDVYRVKTVYTLDEARAIHQQQQRR